MPRKEKIFTFFNYLIAIATIFYIIYKLVTYEQGELFFTKLQHFGFLQVVLLMVVFLLAFPNWGLEAYKWKMLVGNFETIDYRKSFRAVLAGLSVSLFTPNRIGEIPGRSFFLKKLNWTKGMAATGFGSFCQVSTTIVFGVLGFVAMSFLFPEISFVDIHIAFFLGSTVLVMLLCVIIWPVRILTMLTKIPFLKKWWNIAPSAEVATLRQLILKIIALSNFRYVLFVCQFYILLLVFNVDVTIVQSFIAVSLSYFIMLFVPVISLAEVGVRGSTALYCFGLFTQEVPGILLATFTLWAINIAIPALVGGYYFKKLKFCL